jgi:uncharacterized spore protein YtfJ
MKHIAEMLDLLADNLGHIATSEVVVGEPIELDGVTIVPLSRVGVGIGAGGGEGEGELHNHGKAKGKAKTGPGAGKGLGGGTGGGAKVRPVGLIAFTADGVEVQAIPTKKGLLDKLFDKVPEVIELVEKAQDKARQEKSAPA